MSLLNGGLTGSMFVYLASTVAIVTAAYYTTLWIGRKGTALSTGRCIKLLDRATLPGGMVIVVVKIGGRVYILAGMGKELKKVDGFPLEEWQSMCQTYGDENHRVPSLHLWKDFPQKWFQKAGKGEEGE